MNCRDAEKFMMGYMDGELTKIEAEKLHVHLTDCPMCTCAFQLYDHMLKDFDTLEIIEAPEGFEAAVMAKVSELQGQVFQVEYSIKSQVWGHVWGTFTVLFGTGAIVAFYRRPILQALSQNSFLGSQIKALQPVEQELTVQMQMVSGMVDESFSTWNQALSNSAGIVFVVLTLVCFLQYYVIRRKKKKSLVEHK